MKVSIAVAFALLVFLVIPPPGHAGEAIPAAPPAGPVELFNGKDFAGWKFCMARDAAPEATWSITNGVIRCLGKPNGYIRTEKAYADFKVSVEWRFLKEGNTGIMVFMQEPDQVWPRCVECQGMHGHQGDFWLWGGVGCDKPAATLQNGIPVRIPSVEKPVGEWNTMECLCRGNSVEILVNGTRMNGIAGCNVSSGFIGIQSEGADMEVRSIRVEPLK